MRLSTRKTLLFITIAMAAGTVLAEQSPLGHSPNALVGEGDWATWKASAPNALDRIGPNEREVRAIWPNASVLDLQYWRWMDQRQVRERQKAKYRKTPQGEQGEAALEWTPKHQIVAREYDPETNMLTSRFDDGVEMVQIGYNPDTDSYSVYVDDQGVPHYGHGRFWETPAWKARHQAKPEALR